jgi:predicted permease
MGAIRRFLLRLRHSLGPENADAEVDREVRAHLGVIEDQYRSQGLRDDEARLAARRALGGVTQARERHRDARSFQWIENAVRDLSLAGRTLLRARSFSVVAVLTLALGLASTTVLFALVQGVLLKPLPVPDQDRLVIVWKELRTSGLSRNPFGGEEIENVARATRLLESVAGVSWDGAWRWTAVKDGESTPVRGGLVTGRFFEVLGASPVLGRVFTPADDVEGAANVLVVSYGFWQRRYGGATNLIGQGLILDDLPFTIVGVMPPGFDYPIGVDVWRTTRSMPLTRLFGSAAREELDMVARLRPGVSREQAASELTELTRQYEQALPAGRSRGFIPVVHPLADYLVNDVRIPLVAVLAAVGLVLLIATANVANLILMRGETRRAELSVRQALGAGRGRLIRQLLAENLMLALTAGLSGLVFAWWALPALIPLLPDGIPRIHAVRLDARVLAVATAVACIAALLASVPSALFALRLDLVSNLRSGGRGMIGAAGRRGRQVLVVAQIALAAMVVAVAALLAHTVFQLQAVDTGLAADRLLFVDLKLPDSTKEERARNAERVDGMVPQLAGVPGIGAVAPIHVSPLSGGWLVPTFAAEGQDSIQAAANPSLSLESTHPNHFDTLGIAIVRGRAFTAADRKGSLKVAIVSEDMAQVTWPGLNPIGKRLTMAGADPKDEWLTVVGVAGVARYRDLTRPHPTLYLPSAQFIQAAQTLAIRTTAPIDQVAPLVRERLRSVDADISVKRIVPFSALMAVPLARPRFNAIVIGFFGAAALALTTIGLYAVMAASVRQRNHEIAIRVALGATSRTVRRLVYGEVLRLSTLGLVLGLGGVVLTTRFVRDMLFGVDPLDPATLVGAMILVVVAAVLASYPPLRRAVRVDPARMLQSE